MTNQPQDREQVIDLAAVLNILWRRRVLVLALPLLGLVAGALYGIFGTRRWEAYATIRPGITAYDPSGGPVRQWQLKDITRWYEQELYRKPLVTRLGLPSDAHPMIKAEFIAQGLTNLSGGEVITLWTTATSPELAAAILDTSLAVFDEYAEADSVSSQIKMTRDGLEFQVRKIANKVLAIDKSQESLGQRLQAARAESVMVAGKTRELGIDLDLLRRKEDYCRGRITTLAEQRPRLEADLAQLDQVVRKVAAGAVLDTMAIPAWVRRDAVLDGGDILEGLARARLEIRSALAHNRAVSDSLGYAADQAAMEHSRLELKQVAAIKAQLREVQQKINDLVLEGKFDLPSQRKDLALQKDISLSKLSLLSPLQQVGNTIVSDKPVRPRPLRAILILVFLGLVGGCVLGFAWDYIALNRERIFRP